MKLIDILVEETIENGWSWPERANCITQDRDREIMTATCQPSVAKFDASYNRWFLNGSRIGGFIADILANDYTTAIITREQYEAALAAKNEGWIELGGGKHPPVITNTVVDVKLEKGYVQSGYPAGEYSWEHVWQGSNIIAYRLHQPQEAEQAKADDESDLNESIGQDAAPVWSGEGLPPVGCECEYTKESLPGNEWTQCTVDYVGASFVVYRDCYGVELTGIIGDIKFRPIRSEAVRKRDEAVKAIMLTGWCQTAAEEIYDLIAAGKVPGMKLED
ncbi:hypothetical protein LNY92_00335 [Klebsiella pneumoniae]|uniref:hypothetical protein n=1 Tax=Klebsiella pneumoniae TaxID=573 RepID=UPI003B0BB4F2|nr:hypothetical protein [Klebsiella pneumoniae]